ncbi:iron-containing redox enzyme family protein [Candidatus Marinimicrobia bacterium]|nr:iron-containing redox enzyme family protein [Candidatus Neomarinimicrobiota bacterium]MDC0383642.1 iron-containing redox enzyme family protein [Candidatus Neomarinimicrobiota bacterium]
MKTFIRTLKQKTPIHKNYYFAKLRNDELTLEEFQKSQLNFFDAVLSFTKPMFIISSKLDSYEQRLLVLENIFEEHGNGDIAKNHGKTFEEYLILLGVNKKEIKNRRINKSSQNFNLSLIEYSQKESTYFSLAMMGIIEERYSEMSKLISEKLLKNKWLTEKTLVHYKVHEKLDIEHAESFYHLISSKWLDKNIRKDIKKGLLFGNNLILNLYTDLL